MPRLTLNSISSVPSSEVESLAIPPLSQTTTAALSSLPLDASHTVQSSVPSILTSTSTTAVSTPSVATLGPTLAIQSPSTVVVSAPALLSPLSASSLHVPQLAACPRVPGQSPFTPLPYVPAVPWPYTTLPSTLPSPSGLPPLPVFSAPQATQSPLSWPPSCLPLRADSSQTPSVIPPLNPILQVAPHPSEAHRALSQDVAITRARADAVAADHRALIAQLDQQTQALSQIQASSQLQIPGTVPHLFGVPHHLQSFVIGPGFAPIPPKVVSSILAGEYIDLGLLVRKPAEIRDKGPSISLDGRLIIRNQPKPARRLTDLPSWSQAFSILNLILVSYQPHRSPDLLRYQLLILRMFTQYEGLAWFYYDEAFRRDAAARGVTDWSVMNVELFNFHTTAQSSSLTSRFPSTGAESSGSTSSVLPCRSWNAGRCISPNAVCRFRHSCDVPSYHGTHRRVDCPRRWAPPPISTTLPALMNRSSNH